MTRRNLLEQNLTEEKNVKTVVDTAIKADKKFMTRAKRDLEDTIEDLEDKLQIRLSSNTPIDAATIEQTYGALVESKQKLALYESFERNFMLDDLSAAAPATTKE